MISLFILTGLTCAQEMVGSIGLPDTNSVRVAVDRNSFGDWLRHLPLKSAGSAVYDYRGRVHKPGNDGSVAAVVDLDIMGRRLEQCMDILIRLYAQYLWDDKFSEDLILPLPGGYWLAWKDWAEGIRPVFHGIDVKLKKSERSDYSYAQYQKYLKLVYAESHTQQFYYWYQPVPVQDVQIGDFFVIKGSKSHAVMIVDLAVGSDGQKYALIGQGDTPACQFYLLRSEDSRFWIRLDPDEEKLPLPIRRKMTWDGLRRFSETKK
jgi:hypothetical protein